MIINTNQAATILHCTKGTVSKLVRTGKLVARERNPGKRSHLHFDSKVVREFSKIYKNRLNGNGKRVRKQNLDIPNPTGIQTRLTNLESKVQGLEEKIDYLVKLWS